MRLIIKLGFLAAGLLLVSPVLARDAEADSLGAAALEARRTGIVTAAQEVIPSVVSITVLQTRTYSSPFGINPFFQEFFGEMYPHQYSREIQNLGSGLVVSAEGEIVTNAHVVADTRRIKVTLADGRTFDAGIRGMDKGLDLALLELVDPPGDLEPARLGNSDDLLIGEWVLALGNPLGFLIADANPSVTAGVVSAVGRRVQAGQGRKFSYSGVIQTDAAINPGNSGGPLCNILGQVIGINTFIFTKSGGSEGLGFAIPVNQVKKFIYELKSHSKRRIAWLGLGVQTLTSDMARAMDIPGKKGIIITRVFEDTPAESKGLETAWVILSANGIGYPSEADWQMMEQGLFVGDTVKIEGITDEGEPFKRTIAAVEYQSPEPVKIAELGAQVVDLDPAIRYRYDIRSPDGVVVTEVESASKAASLGLTKGDVILAYGNIKTTSIQELKKAVDAYHNPRNLIIERDGGRYRLYQGF